MSRRDLQIETLFNLSQDLLCVASLEPYFLRVNPAFTRTLGYSEAELLSRCYLDLVHPDDRANTQAALQRLRSGKTVVDFVNRYRHRNGSYRWLQWRATPSSDEDTVFAVARDVSIQRAQQAALADNEARYRLLFENMSDGVAVYDVVGDCEDFVFRDMNKAGLRIARLTKADVIGWRVGDVFPGVVRMGLPEVFRSVCRDGQPRSLPVTRYRDKRVELWVENFVFRLPGGEIVAVYRDITETKVAAQRLAESEHRFRLLFEQAPAGINLVDPDGRVLAANHTLLRLFGCSEQQMRSKSFNHWTHPDDVAASHAAMAQLRRGDSDGFAVEKRYVRSDGHVFWAHTTVTAVRREDGELDYLFAMIEDTSDRRRAQAEIQTLLEENRYLARGLIEAQEREREQIARDLHDEIGQNLTAMRAEAATIIARCKPLDQPQVMASAAALEQIAEHLYGMAHDMIGRLRQGHLDDLGLKATIDEQLQHWRQRHPEIQITGQVDAAVDDIPRAVALTLYRVLQEALTNVAKHAQASQVSVRLVLQRQNDKAVEALLDIEDDGVGFVVEPHAGRMGLIGMRERVLSLGGEFRLDSSPGHGVRIKVKIRLKSDAFEKII